MAAAARPRLAGRPKHGPLGSLDRQTMALLPALRCPAGVTAARMVSALAEPGMAAAVLAAHAALRAPRDGWRAACGPAVVVASGTVARRWLSRVIARPRPPATGWLTEPEGFSLPSKHTTLAALTVGALAGQGRSGGGPRHAAPLLAAAGPARAGCTWACTGQLTCWPAGCSPKAGSGWPDGPGPQTTRRGTDHA